MTDGKLQEDYAKLAYEIRLYRKQLTMLQREIEKISLTSMDLSNSVKAMGDIEKGEALIPIGGGSYVKGNISEDGVLVAVGGGYLLEMDSNIAKEKTEKRVDSTKNAVKKLTHEFSKISSKLETVTMQLKELETKILIDRRVEDEASDDYR